MEKVSKIIEDFVKFLQEIPTEYETCTTMDDELLKKVRDIEHDLELSCDLKYHDYAKFGKEIGEVRRKRREFKDKGIVIAPIVQFLIDNKRITDQLSNLVTIVKSKEDLLVNRTYTEKCTIDTKELIGIESTNISVDDIDDYDESQLTTLKVQLANIISNQSKTYEINSIPDTTIPSFNIIIKHNKLRRAICDDICNAMCSEIGSKIFKKNYVNYTTFDKFHKDLDGKRYALCRITVYADNPKEFACILNIKFVEKTI